MERSMFPRPRYHHRMVGVQDRVDEIRGAARVLVRLLQPGNSRSRWPDQSWQSQQRGWMPRRESRLFTSPPSSPPFQWTPRPRRWWPYVGPDQRWGGNPKHFPPRPDPRNWRSRVLPRRGPPVAANRVPRWPRQEEMCERQPRGLVPRGTLREAPKGQPMISSGTLKAVCVEAPKGQPRNHSCRTRRSQNARPRDE